MSEVRHQAFAPTIGEQRASGDVIDRHRHDGHQLIYVSAGVLAITTEHGSWVVPPDRALWIPAGMWHEHRFYGQSTFHTVGFALADTPLPTDGPSVVVVGDLVRGLIMASTQPNLPTDELQRMHAVLRDRLRRAPIEPLTLPTASDSRLHAACQLVLSDLSTPRSLPFLSRHVGASERTLTRLFRDEFGCTYPQWRTHARIFHAMLALADGATVTSAGRDCGWATTSAFVETFRHTIGQTPGRFRTTFKRVVSQPK